MLCSQDAFWTTVRALSNNQTIKSPCIADPQQLYVQYYQRAVA